MEDLQYYFPKLEDNNYEKLQIDNVGKYSITIPKIADIITDIIYKLYKRIDITITDMTAGVGGNVISFANKFKHVNAIEIDKNRYDMLVNNIDIYNFKNVNHYNENCLDIIHTLNQDVIFFDPPWGGIGYKNEKNIILTIDNIHIEEICNLLLDTNKCEYIVVKLPLNYNINYIKNSLPENRELIIHKLQKMLLVIFKSV